MVRPRVRLLFLLPFWCALSASIGAADEAGVDQAGVDQAGVERVRLRSGRELEVASVRVLTDRLNVSVVADGSPSRVDLLFERVEPQSLLRIVDAHSDPKDARAWLRSARLAFAGGLHDHAAARYVEAARLNPALRDARNEGLAAIRRAEAQAGLDDLEKRLRDGRDPRGAALLADAILDSAFAAELTAAQRRRVAAFGALARRLAKRVLERLAAQKKASLLGAAAQAAGAAQGGAAPPAPDDPPVEAEAGPADALAPLRAQLAKAIHAREVAADPAVPVGDALRHLEIAAHELLDGRRAAHGVRVEALDEESAVELDDIGLDLRALLLSTYLELADLYRQRHLFEEARARVRAVLILDPGNEQAWSQRHLIEDDLREASEPLPDPYRYTIRSAAFFGWYSPSPYHYGGCLTPRIVPAVRGGAFFGYRSGGLPRAVPTRSVPYRRATGRRR